MKLTKKQIKIQKQCEEILLKEELSFDEKVFVLENWHEGATNINSSAGAFFTPFELAKDFGAELLEDCKTVDLCAGIGMLTFIAYHFKNCRDITCYELNSDYVRVGKKLLPEAKWVNASIFNTEFDYYDQVISNPPFGNIKTRVKDTGLKYRGSEFDLKTIEIASQVANYGVFILPQQSTPFKFSKNETFEDLRGTNSLPKKVAKFIKETGIDYEFNCGIDTSFYLKKWKGVSPVCEIVTFNFSTPDITGVGESFPPQQLQLF